LREDLQQVVGIRYAGQLDGLNGAPGVSRHSGESRGRLRGLRLPGQL
jgi:hypothetical protein